MNDDDTPLWPAVVEPPELIPMGPRWFVVCAECNEVAAIADHELTEAEISDLEPPCGCGVQKLRSTGACKIFGMVP